MTRYFTFTATTCIVGSALLHGCATKPPPAPAEIRAQALGPIEFDRPWQATEVAGSPVQDDWLSSFNDAQLDALVREAIANNPDLRVAVARLEQAAQYLVIAQSTMRPAIALAGTGGAKAGGGGDTNSALQGVVLAASWELDLWGRVRYQRNAARESYASAQADFQFARQSLAAATAKAWFVATQLSLHASLAAAMTDSARQLQSFAQQRERVGIGSPADTAVVRATVRGFENTLQQVEFARGQALRALEQLVGRYPAAEVAARAELLSLPAPLPAGIPLQMLERRPDVIAAERRVAAAFNRVGEAKAARLPQITLSLNVGAFASEILELQEDYENPTGGLGARLLAPIYQGGALTAQVRLRTAEQKEAAAQYAKTALRALGEVENSLAANASLAARSASLTEVLREQERALAFTETNYRVGRADRRALEQQRINVQQAQLALLNVRSDALAERVNLHLALGGRFAPPAS